MALATATIASLYDHEEWSSRCPHVYQEYAAGAISVTCAARRPWIISVLRKRSAGAFLMR